MKRKKVWKVVTSVILFILLLFVLVPLAWAISLSFDRKALTSLPEFSLIPHQPTTFNYEVAWRNLDLLTLYGNKETAKGQETWLVGGHGKASATECIKCGKCEEVCPQHIKIRDHLEEICQTLLS